jgi:hypothetical protein
MANIQTEGIGKGSPGPGRPKGSANKATSDARKAIAAFVDGNAHRLEGWLDEVAGGIMDPSGEKYAVAPNPARAFELFQSVVEYHIPKLARTEVSGDPNNPMVHNVEVTFK